MIVAAKESTVSIHSARGSEPAGGGALVGLGLVATCSHVINAAFDRGSGDPRKPAEDETVQVRLTFAGAAEEDRFVTGHVVHWEPYLEPSSGSDDLCLLKLDRDVPTASRLCFDVTDSANFDTWGYHRNHSEGAFIESIFQAFGPTSRIQFRGDNEGDAAFIEPGASGCGVFLKNTNKLIGIVTGNFIGHDNREALAIGAIHIRSALDELGVSEDPLSSQSDGAPVDWREYEPDPVIQDAWREEFRGPITAQLRSIKPENRASITRIFEGFSPNTLENRWADEYFDYFLSSDPEISFKSVLIALTKLVNRREENDAETLRGVFRWLSAVKHGPTAEKFIAWAKTPDGTISFVPAAGSFTKTEALAAGIDEMPVDLLEQVAQGALTAGRYRIPFPPEAGPDPDGNQYLNEFIQFLSGQLDPEGFVNVISSWVSNDLTEQAESDISRERLQSILQTRKGSDRSFYLTVPGERMLDEHSLPRMIEVTRRVMELFPEIHVIAIDTAKIGDDREVQAYLPLASATRRSQT